MMQGTATLIATQRVSETQTDPLIDDAVAVLLQSELGRSVLSLSDQDRSVRGDGRHSERGGCRPTRDTV